MKFVVGAFWLNSDVTWASCHLKSPANWLIVQVGKKGNTKSLHDLCKEEPPDTSGFPWQHDDVIKWKHFPRYWPFVRGIHRSPVNSPHKGQWRGALMFSLICARINDWVNNREAGDWRRRLAHYDVTVMKGPAMRKAFPCHGVFMIMNLCDSCCRDLWLKGSEQSSKCNIAAWYTTPNLSCQ